MGRMRMFLRPRWVITHLVVVAIAATFVSLGLWQLDRLAERRADNERIAQNMSGDARPLTETLEQYGNDPDALSYRRVVVTGTYRPADEVLLTPRANGRSPGHHVVTPLAIDAGQAVLVDRGWVPFADDEPPVDAAAPPSDVVTVEGILLPTAEAGRFGAADGGDRITFLSTVDVDRLQPQVDIALLPVSVLLQKQQPAPGDLPIPGAPPAQSEGPHQSYAWQWFSFTAILLIGYPLLLRRSLAGAESSRRRDRHGQPEVG